MTLDYTKYYNFYDNQIAVDIIADSMDVRRGGKRITTFLLTIPQSVLAHLVRHRVFSFSVSSKRALSHNRMATSSNFKPVFRFKDSRGMQPKSFVDEDIQMALEEIWRKTYYYIDETIGIYYSNMAKEIVNSLTVPWQLINVLLTGTDFQNFFNLRIHPDTQLETQVVAYKMREALENNTPKYLEKGDWHIPFWSEDMEHLSLFDQLAISAARCARTSYILPGTDKKSDIHADLALCKKLLTTPFHASPFEHQATPALFSDLYPELPHYSNELNSKYHANFQGWVQLRKLIEIHGVPNYLIDAARLGKKFRHDIH